MGVSKPMALSIPLETAEKAATDIVDALTPYCERIAVAGSIRRKKPWVHDIDLVLIPKDLWGFNQQIVRLGVPVQMSEIQSRIAQLQAKGWTLINIARALGQSSVTIEAWKAGTRSPANLQSVLSSLDQLAKRKRIPPKRQSNKLGEL